MRQFLTRCAAAFERLLFGPRLPPVRLPSRVEPDPVPDLSAVRPEELAAKRELLADQLRKLNWEILAGEWPSPTAEVLNEWRFLWMLESALAAYPGGAEVYREVCAAHGIEGRREARPALAAMAGDVS